MRRPWRISERWQRGLRVGNQSTVVPAQGVRHMCCAATAFSFNAAIYAKHGETDSTILVATGSIAATRGTT